MAVDFANTVTGAGVATVDLLSRTDSAQQWWTQQAQAQVLPPGTAPDFQASGKLRTALRQLFEAAIAGRSWPQRALSTINTFAANAPVSEAIAGGRVVLTPNESELARTLDLAQGTMAERRWHAQRPGQAMLAAIAEDAIRLLADEPRRMRLRRCANPGCSIIFLAKHPRRVWCSGSTCGNRRRVARHDRSARTAATKEQS